MGVWDDVKHPAIHMTAPQQLCGQKSGNSANIVKICLRVPIWYSKLPQASPREATSCL